MINTYIQDSLIRELRHNFPNRLPTQEDIEKGLSIEKIAFESGKQFIIDYLTVCANAQRKEEEE